MLRFSLNKMTTPLLQMSTAMVTAILASNFDPASLSNRLADAGVRLPADFDDFYNHAVRAVYQSQPLRQRLSTMLDRMHYDRLVEVRNEEPELLKTWCHCANFSRCPDIGGILWAFARDSRPEVQESLQRLIARIQVRAHQEQYSQEWGEESEPC